MKTLTAFNPRIFPAFAFAAMMLVGCGDMVSEPPAIGLRVQELDAVCQVPVQGHGTVDMEDYVANVIACESAPNSSLETLKAQAIAARTYAVFKLKVEKRSQLINGQSNQVYKCSYASPTALHRQAASATAGQIITHNNLVTAAFYVAGVKPTTASCIPSARDKANANSTERRTEGYVTYNEGRFGSNLRRANSPIGHPGNPHNIGVYSQNGAKCLGEKGRSANGILRFYYGDDMRVETMPGACGGDPTNTDTGSPDPNNGSCETGDQAPSIVPRSSWGARSPKSNRSTHTPNRLTIHHTVQGNVSGPAAVRQVQNWHMDGNGWADIGYHFLIDRDGTIYAANPENRVGAHVLNQNRGNLGISLIGSFHKEQLPDAQKRAAAAMVRYLGKKYNITINRNNVKGHGERMSTECPGGNVNLDEIVQLASSDTICEPTEEPDDNIEPMFEYELPDLEVDGEAVAGYRYLRLTHVSGSPFIVDAAYFEQGQGRKYAASAQGSGVENAGAAAGKADVVKCEDLNSKAAKINPGGQLTLTFDEGLEAQSAFFVQGQSVTVIEDEPCDNNFDGKVKAEGSIDGQNWDILTEEMSTNSSAAAAPETLAFIKPMGSTAPREATFEVAAAQNVVRVDYYAEKNFLGSAKDRRENYSLTYKFQQKGKRLISAWGYTAEGKIVAMAEKYVTITDGIDFIAPTEGKTYKPDMVFTVATVDDIKNVKYFVDDKEVASSGDKGSNFPGKHFFKEYGDQTITAVGYDRNGTEYARTKITIKIDEDGSNFRFINPKAGGVYKESVTFIMEVTDPEVFKVKYIADGKYEFGESTDKNNQFNYPYTFNQLGKRKIDAKGYDREGQHIATATITITITDQNGGVPDGNDNYDPGNDPTNPNGGGSQPNTQLAGDLATEAAKLYHPTKGQSSGSRGWCWAYVKAAMERARVTRPAGYNGGAYTKLASGGGCTQHGLYVSAYCFGKTGEANPQGMFDGFQMEQVNVSPQNAQRGDVIVWDRRCAGFNASHGHIEVAQGDGTACSDYCGRIRSGGESCSWVFRAVSSQGNTNQPPATSNTQVGDACTLNGQEGACLREASNCGGSEGQGTCGTGQKCCVKGCTASGQAGQCLNTGSCQGTTTANLCPGPSNVRCCTAGGGNPNNPMPSSMCLQDLQSNGVNYSTWNVGTRYAGGRRCNQSTATGSASRACPIQDAISVNTPINGISYRYVDSSSNRSSVKASCRLGEALRKMGDILKRYNIVQVIDIGTYCCRLTSGGGMSNHSYADAIDVYGFVDSSGERYILEDHWEHNTTTPTTRKGRVLYEIAQALYNSGAFNLVLTPNYNSEHDNHFHLDMGSSASGIRLQQSSDVYFGSDASMWKKHCDH